MAHIALKRYYHTPSFSINLELNQNFSKPRCFQKHLLARGNCTQTGGLETGRLPLGYKCFQKHLGFEKFDSIQGLWRNWVYDNSVLMLSEQCKITLKSL